MNYILENDIAYVEISDKACEIHHFYLKNDQIERMWQGDVTHWAGRNPILFPQVGNTYNKIQVLKNKKCHMGNHGLARHAIFKLVDQDKKSLTFEFKDDEKTYEDYPYHFSLIVKYELNNAKLDISYLIKNLDKEAMPFGFGLHPAFNCPLYDDETFSDYKIYFNHLEKGNEDEYKLIKGHDLKLNHDLFEEFPTIIFQNLTSSYVKLESPKSSLKVEVANYPYLAFWTSDKNADFLCIEPWYSHGDFQEVNLPFKDREGIINIASNTSFFTRYAIEILK